MRNRKTARRHKPTMMPRMRSEEFPPLEGLERPEEEIG